MVQKKTTPDLQKRLVKLKSVSYKTLEDGQCQVTVSLACKRKNHTSERIGPNEIDYVVMLAALSTIDALHAVTAGQLQMDLLFIERQNLERVGREIIMVLIDVNSSDGTKAATGACQVRGDLAETAARAVLDATNRMVELCLKATS